MRRSIAARALVNTEAKTGMDSSSGDCAPGDYDRIFGHRRFQLALLDLLNCGAAQKGGCGVEVPEWRRRHLGRIEGTHQQSFQGRIGEAPIEAVFPLVRADRRDAGYGDEEGSAR